jgi:hypothetical protein
MDGVATRAGDTHSSSVHEDCISRVMMLCIQNVLNLNSNRERESRAGS